jgi:hypothetical protein
MFFGIPFPNGFPNGSAIPALIYQFIKKIPLVAHNFFKRALRPLDPYEWGVIKKIFGTKNKGIKARLGYWAATKGILINR